MGKKVNIFIQKGNVYNTRPLRVVKTSVLKNGTIEITITPD
jgi:hypothetical protein